jgi:aminopeptidase N
VTVRQVSRPDMLDRADDLDVLRYGLTVDLTRSATSAIVTSRVEFGWRGREPATFADLDATTLASAELNGRPLPPDAYSPGVLHLAPLEPTNVLTVEAWVDLSDDGYGICGVDDPADGRRYVYTRGTPMLAPRIMCCFQYAQRAPIDVSVVTPAGWTCVAHTPAVESPPAGAAGTWRFATTPPMSPEHVAIAAGPLLTYAPGGTGRRSVEAALARSRAGRLAADCLAMQSELLGIPYPYERLDLVFVPGYSALGTSTPGVLMLDERVLHRSLDPDGRRFVVWALAHEVAHVWFGSLVVDRRWEATWLTEGLATYLCYVTMDALMPEVHPWALFHLLEEAEAHEVDVEGVHAVAPPPLADPVPPIVYAKPAALVRQLATTIGDGAVFRGLAAYLRDHAFGDATTGDLVAAWSTASGRDLTGWARDWLRRPGIDTLELRLRSRAGCAVESAVTRHPARPGDPPRSQTITVAAYDATGERLVARRPIQIDQSSDSTPASALVGGRPPDLVLLNSPATAYVKVRLDDRSRATIATHMHHLDAHARATCWVAAWEMVADGAMPKNEFALWVERYAEREPDAAVRDVLRAKLD